MVTFEQKITPVDILAVGAHPDDVELGCSGTLLKHIDMGYSVGLLDLTKGELGSRGTPEQRLVEAENARKIMGADWRVNLGLADGFFEINEENLLKVATVIRAARPKIMLINAPYDRHPDHGRGADLALKGSFYSGLLMIDLTYDGEKLDKHRPQNIFHYIQDREMPVDFVVDITDYIDHKMKCVQAFETQFYQGKNDDGPKTPISSKQFFDFVRSKNAVYGRDIQADYAEGFVNTKINGIADLVTLK